MHHFELRNSADGVVGTAHCQQDGWRFMPRVSGRKPSTKRHETAVDSVPAWARKYLTRGEWRKVEA